MSAGTTGSIETATGNLEEGAPVACCVFSPIACTPTT